MSTSVGSPPINTSSNESVGARNQTVPAVPSPSLNGNGFQGDHGRKPSMTVTPAGANFNITGGNQGKTASIQFGSVNNGGGQPAVSTPQMAHQSANSLGVNALNPRGGSPSGSPSPIPQPVSASGGRPPSNFGSQGNGISFGQAGPEGNDPSGLSRPMSNMSFNPQQEHMRRSSSQSMHGDMGNVALPTGPGGRNAYPAQPGRGRGNYYQNQMAYQPHQNFSPTQNGRGGARTQFAGRGQHQHQHQHQHPYQGSPNLGTRSPMMHAASPGTPQMGQMNMMPGMPGPQGYPYPVGGPFLHYPVTSEFVRGKLPLRGKGRTAKRSIRGGSSVRPMREDGSRMSRDPALDINAMTSVAAAGPNLVPHTGLLYPDLSPESGNFEHFLTYRKQGYPTQADPSIQYMYANNYQQFPNQYYQQGGPPQSPRPPYQQPGYPHMQQYNSQGPPSMSRQSSQMSTATDRPGSSIGQTNTSGAHAVPRAPSVSAEPKASFTLPKKTNAAIVIKNAAGEVVDIKKSSTSVAPTPSTPTPATATPPPRTGSAAGHARSDSSALTDEEKKKAFQDAVKAKQEREAAEKALVEKEQIEKEAAEAEKLKAEEAREAAEALEKEAQAAQAASAAKVDDKKPEPEPVNTTGGDDEIDFDAIEAELAAQEAEEARREEEYQKKKAAERELKIQKEKEEAAAYEANMKEMERKAEEDELARERKRAEGSSDTESRKLFAALKNDAGDAGDSSAAEETPAETPAESGAATPVSDSMPPPSKSLASGRKKIADLVLDTKKSIEPPEPSATLKSLTVARRLADPTAISYPEGIVSPNPALNANAPADRRFKYNKEFLLQFQSVFKEKPSLDWDAKIRDALGDPDGSARPNTARTPSSSMGPRSQSRPQSINIGAFTHMGGFNNRTTLPPGTTSEQRFAAATQAARGGAPNPFAFGRPNSMGPQAGRSPSNNPMGGAPGSPRPGASRGGRQESKRAAKSAKQEAEANKTMPLTAGMNITTLETSSTGWKPRSLGQNTNAGPVPGGDGLLEPDVVQRKVKAALNKMTPEKFDRIADQILDIAAQSKHESDGRTLRQVIQLTFEKATDEAHWAPMYAMFCRKMLQSMSADIKDENVKDKNGEVVTGGNLFRKYLLNRCQEEFERGWKVNLPPPKEGESGETAMMSDEYYEAMAAKRRGLGLVKFIGELFKLGMLTERIMHECVKKLLDYEGTPEEAEVESLTSLLRTIGKQLDSSESKAQGRMDIYFQRITQTMDLQDLPSRLRYMLMDVVDLRKNGWVSKLDDKGPKTIQEIREEAERQAQQAEMQRLAQQAGRNSGGRMPMGRGDARSFSGYGPVPPPDNSNRVGADDLRRLGGRSSRNTSSTGPQSLGPSLMGGRTNSGRRGLGPSSFLGRGDDSQASSRTGTPPAQKDDKKKDESATNAFSALAALEGEEHEDPSSPPAQKAQPAAPQATQEAGP